MHRRLDACRCGGTRAVEPRKLREDLPHDGGSLRRPARSGAEHRGGGAALRLCAALSQADPAQPRGRPRRRGTRARGRCAQGSGGTARALWRDERGGTQGLFRPAAVRGRHHQPDGFPGLLPDRCRLHQMGQGPRYSRGTGAWFGCGQPCRLVADDHRSRPDPARPAVRTLPQSRTRLDARLRYRLLRNPPRRGDPLRPAEIRPRPRRADHHLRQAQGARGAARYGADPADELRPCRPAVQDGAQPPDRSVDAAARAQRRGRFQERIRQ